MNFGKDNTVMRNIGATPDEIMKILSKTKMGFCLDIAHAWESVCDLNMNPMQTVSNFIELKPDYFHISDSRIKPLKQHLHLGEGELDVPAIKRLLPGDAWVMLETPMILKAG